MNLLDITGRGSHLINLDLVRCIRTEDVEEKVELKCIYGNGDESIFHVSQARYAALVEILRDLEILAA